MASAGHANPLIPSSNRGTLTVFRSATPRASKIAESMNSSPARRQRLSARSATLATIVAASAALLVGCSNTADGSTSTPASTSSRAPKPATTGVAPATSSSHQDSTTPATEPTSTWTPQQQQIIDDYIAARKAFSTSLEHPDPNNPALLSTHVEPMLTEVRNTNAKWQGFGQAGRFPDKSVARTDVLKVDITGDAASIETCGVDDSVVYESATGKVLNSDVVTVNASATLKRSDRTWKLATRIEVQRWEGVAGCAPHSS